MSLAVGVMARAPVPGACKTRLLAAHEPGWVAALYAAMLADTLEKLASLGADTTTVFLAPEEGAERAFAPHRPAGWGLVLQEGPDLGARLEHAFASLFAGGATCALVCGSDAPTFAPEPLAAALGRLGGASGELLLAPCEDGGYALIALTRPEPRLFRSMPWSTPSVLRETRARAAACGLVVRELPTGYDVDEPADVVRLTAELDAAPHLAPHTARHLSAGGAASTRHPGNPDSARPIAGILRGDE